MHSLPARITRHSTLFSHSSQPSTVAQVRVLGAFTAESGTASAMFTNVAKMFLGDASFGEIRSPAVAEAANMSLSTSPLLAQFRGLSPTRWDYHGEWEAPLHL